MKASCAWGDCVDVLVSLDGTNLMLYEEPKDFVRYMHGVVTKGSFQLTIAEARLFAYALLDAAMQSEELEQQCRDHDPEPMKPEENKTKDPW